MTSESDSRKPRSTLDTTLCASSPDYSVYKAPHMKKSTLVERVNKFTMYHPIKAIVVAAALGAAALTVAAYGLYSATNAYLRAVDTGLQEQRGATLKRQSQYYGISEEEMIKRNKKAFYELKK